jgi:hypothetical protein
MKVFILALFIAIAAANAVPSETEALKAYIQQNKEIIAGKFGETTNRLKIFKN